MDTEGDARTGLRTGLEWRKRKVSANAQWAKMKAPDEDGEKVENGDAGAVAEVGGDEKAPAEDFLYQEVFETLTLAFGLKAPITLPVVGSD